MDTLLTSLLRILEFILALGVLVFLHELGHFLVSRFFKIEIEEFGFGFPPRMVKLFKLGGTDFTINWIPFGAFVRPKGENDPEVPGGLASASPWVRLAVLLGGPVMNLLTGVILFTIMFSRGSYYDITRVEIAEVAAASPAEQAGLLPGDLITAIDGKRVDGSSRLQTLVLARAGQEITLTVERDGEKLTFTTTPRVSPPEGQGALGIVMTSPIVENQTFAGAADMALRYTWQQCVELLRLPGRLIAGTISPEESRVVGPVGMYNMYDYTRELDEEASSNAETNPAATSNTLRLIAVISVALGFTNLLPIPALDGGRILLTLPELITGKRRISVKLENALNAVGFILLLALLAFTTLQDIINPLQLK